MIESAVTGARVANADDVRHSFRTAMRGIAATVHIITAVDRDGGWKGMTATAVTSVSMDPPSCVICLNGSASISTPLIETGVFCINVLAEDHHHLAAVFSDPARRATRFDGSAWRTGPSGVPYSADAQAVLFCRLAKAMPFGSHHVVVGEVTEALVGAAARPLIYCDGEYRAARNVETGLVGERTPRSVGVRS